MKSKVHLPGQKKRQNNDGQANEGDGSDYSSDDSPKVRTLAQLLYLRFFPAFLHNIQRW